MRPSSKQWRYVDKLQELRLEESQAEIRSLRARVLMEQMLNASVSCNVKRKVLEMRCLRADCADTSHTGHSVFELSSRRHNSSVFES